MHSEFRITKAMELTLKMDVIYIVFVSQHFDHPVCIVYYNNIFSYILL